MLLFTKVRTTIQCSFYCALILCSSPLVAQSGWQIRPISRLVLPEGVGQVRGLAPLKNGQIAVLDRHPPFVHIIREDGALARSFLPQGQGPGHGVMPTGIGVISDTVWVWDPGTGRLSFFSLFGELIREYPLRVQHPVYPLGRNRWLVLPITVFSGRDEATRVVSLNTVDSLGRLQGTFSRFTDTVPTLLVRRGNETQVGRQPFVPPIMVLPYPDADRNGIAIANPRVGESKGRTSFHLKRLDAAGRIVFNGRVEIPALRLTQSHLSAATEQLSMGDQSPQTTRRVREAIVSTPYLPAFAWGLIGQQGETWFRHFDVDPSAAASWFVVDVTGRVIGTVAFPGGERLASLYGDRAVAMSNLPDGKEVISWWEVIRVP